VRELHRTVIVPYTPAQMFELVADVERYPEFVPWCAGAELLDRNADTLTGRIEMAMGPLTGHLTTRNRLEPPSLMTLELVEGPFSDLQGEWSFTALGDAGCQIDLTMRFAFSNHVKDLVLGKAFEQTCNRLVDAFVTRAGEIYG
jgi:ribosome-associated toxin RatA of RatAB toxin-antitoxin module